MSSSSHIAKTLAGIGIAGIATAGAYVYQAQQEKDKERSRAKSVAEKAEAELQKAKIERQRRRGDFTPKGKDGDARGHFQHCFDNEMYFFVNKCILKQLVNLRKALENSFSSVTVSRSSNDSVVVFMACFAGAFDNRIRSREQYDDDEEWSHGKLRDFVDLMVNDLDVDPNASLGLGSTRLSPAALVVVRRFLQHWSQQYNVLVLDGCSLRDPVQIKFHRALHVKVCQLARAFDSAAAVGLTHCQAVTFFPTAAHKYDQYHANSELLELSKSFTNEMKIKWTISCISKLEEFGLVCTPATTAGTLAMNQPSKPENSLLETRKERETQINQYCYAHGLPLVEIELLSFYFLVKAQPTEKEERALQQKSHLGFVHLNTRHYKNYKNYRRKASSKTYTRDRLPSLAERMQTLLDDGSSSNVCIESFAVSNFNITESFCGKVPLAASSFVINECHKINTKKVRGSGGLAVSSTCRSFMDIMSRMDEEIGKTF